MERHAGGRSPAATIGVRERVMKGIVEIALGLASDIVHVEKQVCVTVTPISPLFLIQIIIVKKILWKLANLIFLLIKMCVCVTLLCKSNNTK